MKERSKFDELEEFGGQRVKPFDPKKFVRDDPVFVVGALIVMGIWFELFGAHALTKFLTHGTNLFKDWGFFK